MTLCNNNDQACFPDTVTSAGPLGGHYNPCFSGSGFNTTLWVQQMLMHRKTCLIPIFSDKGRKTEWVTPRLLRMHIFESTPQFLFMEAKTLNPMLVV